MAEYASTSGKTIAGAGLREVKPEVRSWSRYLPRINVDPAVPTTFSIGTARSLRPPRFLRRRVCGNGPPSGPRELPRLPAGEQRRVCPVAVENGKAGAGVGGSPGPFPHWCATRSRPGRLGYRLPSVQGLKRAPRVAIVRVRITYVRTRGEGMRRWYLNVIRATSLPVGKHHP